MRRTTTTSFDDVYQFGKAIHAKIDTAASGFLETRALAASSLVEYLIGRYGNQNGLRPPLTKRVFQEVRPVLAARVEALLVQLFGEGLSAADRHEMASRTHGFNDPTLRRKLRFIVDGLELPFTDEDLGKIRKVCYVIRVRESDLGPHFINGRKGVYVRSDEFSSRFKAQLANDNELRHLFNRREIVRTRRANLIRRSRERFETFIAQRYRELGDNPKGSIGARFDLSIGPRFPAHEVCSHDRLISVLPAERISWRQVGFPRSPENLISQHESVISLRPGSSFSILEANTWGMLFYATEIEFQPATHAHDVRGIHSFHFVGALLVFLEHAGIVFRKIGYAARRRSDSRFVEKGWRESRQ